MTTNMLAEENVMKAIQDGPRIRFDYNRWIVARDRARGWSLHGGLGCLGVGQMWIEDSDRTASLPGYEDAPDRDSAGQFGTPEALQ